MKVKRNLSVVIALLLALVMLSACGGGTSSGTTSGAPSAGSGGSAAGEEIVISYPTFQIGVNTAAPAVAALVESFNAEYAGKYRIQVEEVPGDSNYDEKIKTLLATDQLPDVVYGGGYALLDLCLEQAVDLTPYLDADPEWKGLFDQATLDWNTRDGKIYAVPNEGSVIGYYYNAELFEQVGLEGPAKTWDEFIEQCELFLENGITPLALNTSGSAWTTQLWVGAFIGGQSAEMAEWMNTFHPTDYNFPEMVEGISLMQTMLQKYTFQDAVGGKTANAANHFIAGKAAMFANGPWGIGDFSDPELGGSDEFAAKVRSAIFPGNVAFSAPMEGFFVCAKDEAHIEASVAMIKWFTSKDAQLQALEMVGMIPAGDIEIPDAVKEANPLLAVLLDEVAGATYTFNYLSANAYPNVVDAVSQNIPVLVEGNMTPEEFAVMLTEEAQKNL